MITPVASEPTDDEIISIYQEWDKRHGSTYAQLIKAGYALALRRAALATPQTPSPVAEVQLRQADERGDEALRRAHALEEALEYLFLAIVTRADFDYLYRAVNRADEALRASMPGWAPPVPMIGWANPQTPLVVPSERELPPLPETRYVIGREGDGYSQDRLLDEPGYTADQMREYALRAIAESPKPEATK